MMRKILVKCPECGRVASAELPVGIRPDETMTFVCCFCASPNPGERVLWAEESIIPWGLGSLQAKAVAGGSDA